MLTNRTERLFCTTAGPMEKSSTTFHENLVDYSPRCPRSQHVNIVLRNQFFPSPARHSVTLYFLLVLSKCHYLTTLFYARSKTHLQSAIFDTSISIASLSITNAFFFARFPQCSVRFPTYRNVPTAQCHSVYFILFIDPLALCYLSIYNFVLRYW